MVIHFFQPDQFNRTERKTNPFFDPIIAVCERERIPYRVFCAEWHRSESGYGAKWGNSWILFLAEVLALRCVKWFKVSPQRSYRVWGWMANLLTFGHYRADICITVAGMHLEILQGVAPKARLVDLQHGIIYSTHSGYFDSDGVLLPQLAENLQREYWLYGDGYREVFLRNSKNHALLGGKLHVVGDILRARGTEVQSLDVRRTRVILAFQFTPDFDSETLRLMKGIWERFLDSVRDLVASHGLEVLIRHHPRFAGVVDFSDWEARYPWLKTDTRSLQDSLSGALCCVTINSTVVFDAAAWGVPTVLLDGVPLGGGDIFVTEYGYPYATCSMDELLRELSKSSSDVSEMLSVWYNGFYAKFDGEKVLRLLLSSKGRTV